MTKRHAISLLKGFTIVELAIVISVIGILAAITVVSYSGSQVRARNAKTAAAALQYKEAFENYLTLKKAYPAVDVNQNYCLNIPNTSCVNTTAQAWWMRSTTLLEDELKSMMDRLPLPAITSGASSTGDPVLGYIPYRGGTAHPLLDGTNSGFIIYILEGLTTCPVGPIASNGWPNFLSAAPAEGRTYASGNLSICWVPLPRP